MRVCTRSEGRRSCLSLTNTSHVEKQKRAFFTRRGKLCLASDNAFFVGISAANPVQREPQGIKVKAEKANFGVIKRYHCSFFSVARPQLTPSIRAVKIQGPGSYGEWTGPRMVRFPVPAWRRIEAETGWRQNQATTGFSEEGKE